MKNNTPSDILQVYRRILTGQLIVVGRHSRKTADGPIVNTLRVVPHFYRTKKFSVLWILFPDHRTGYMVASTIPHWCPGDDARRLGLLYWLIVYTVRRSFCEHTSRGISNNERITKTHKIKIVSRKTVATVVRDEECAYILIFFYIIISIPTTTIVIGRTESEYVFT